MTTHLDYNELTAAERPALIAEIWDSLDSGDVPLTDAERAELDCRRDDMDSDCISGIPWEQVRKQIEFRPE